MALAIRESTVKYRPLFFRYLTTARWDIVWCSLTGVVASESVSEAFKGMLSTLGNRTWSALA